MNALNFVAHLSIKHSRFTLFFLVTTFITLFANMKVNKWTDLVNYV